MTSITSKAWTESFSSANNLKGWEKTGVYPFTRCVQKKIASQELENHRKTGHLRYKHAPPTTNMPLDSAFNMCANALATPGPTTQDSEDDDGTEEGMKSHFSSAFLWDLGPVTSTKALTIVKERHLAKVFSDTEKKRKAEQKNDEVSIKRVKLHEIGRDLVDSLNAGTKTEATLTCDQLDACKYDFL